MNMVLDWMLGELKYMFNHLFQFLKSKPFYWSISIYTLVVVGSFVILLSWLNDYTRHGEFIKVPDYAGVPVEKLDEFSKRNKLNY